MFRVSVIVPLYNAGQFIRNALNSVLVLEEVGEVIVIDDGFPDDAFAICTSIASSNPKVKLFRHPNGENRGAGASRNLGIRHASCEYIAFLDADDWYLPNRFTAAKDIFQTDPSVDGVYDATGFYYEDRGIIDPGRLTTLNHEVPPQKLLSSLLQKGVGYFHTNAITVKKSLLVEAGLFDESLRLHQDTHLWLRLAYKGKLLAGNIREAVAVRRVHSENRIAGKNRESKNMLDRKIFEWFRDKPVEKPVYRIFFRRFVAASRSGMGARLAFMLSFLASHPGVIRRLL